MSERLDGRTPLELRATKITPGFTKYAEGSVLIEVGSTKVICNATVDEKVPNFLKGKGNGWVTAEYSMLPRATESRTNREVNRGAPSGRTHEIQRLIGRSLRAVIDMKALGERTVTIDCDVIQADGGTRTASITGGFVALALALNKSVTDGKIAKLPLKDYLAAVSVGVVENRVLLDLAYTEDSVAEVDMNIIKMGDGRFVELQGTAEHEAFSRDQMNELIAAAEIGIEKLMTIQRAVIEESIGKSLF